MFFLGYLLFGKTLSDVSFYSYFKLVPYSAPWNMQQEEEKYKERNKDFVGSLLSRKLEGFHWQDFVCLTPHWFVNLWNPFSLWVSAWSIRHKGIHWDWAMPNQENKEARWKRIKMQVQTFKRNGLAFKLDRNSYSYPIQSPRFGDISGRKQATLLRQAGCNQGPRPWQPICSPSTSTLIPPLIIFSTYFPSPHTFSPLLCFLM